MKRLKIWSSHGSRQATSLFSRWKTLASAISARQNLQRNPPSYFARMAKRSSLLAISSRDAMVLMEFADRRFPKESSPLLSEYIHLAGWAFWLRRRLRPRDF